MKVAHIILVHHQPIQLKRLLLRLEHANCKAFVHLDSKCNLKDFAFLETHSFVELISDRQNVTWGGFSIVKAIMASIKQIIKSTMKYDYINLISGQDYALKSSETFMSFLEDNPRKIFMEYHLPGHPWLEEAKKRFSHYHFTDFNFKGKTRLEKVINFFFRPQKMPADFVFIGHSGWFTLDWESAVYVVDYFANNKSVIWKFKWSWGADEILIQSILYNSPYQYKLVNNNLRYIDWSEGKVSPKILTMADQPKLMTTDCFFGRKFDINVDESILNYIDQAIHNEANDKL
ncbi:beta-1,6-N-acetylglucosaminyltransferase [Pedobacter immunditicola]|uniref:beta-1,6-N-acetylglucosaminyltransferase n=1 Tax=Pedobacter immunditicola TaxID=3133440 RepID=UPI003096B37B